MIARLLISQSPELIKQEITKTLASHLEGGNINHPDVLYFPVDTKLGIEQARKIKEHFSLKPFSASSRVVILEDGSRLTIEAQNALLKTLEELPKEAILIMGAPSESKFLPTILSRCLLIRINDKGEKGRGYEESIEKLISANIEERFAYIEKLKDKEEFLKALTAHFHQNLRLHPEDGNLNFLNNLLHAEEWANQNVNIRAVLEYLMLVIPRK